MNTRFHLRHDPALWAPLLFLALAAPFASAQADPGTQPTPDQPGASIAQVAQPLQAGSGTRADLRSTVPTSVAKDYKIGVDDVLTVNVWHEPDLSRNIIVRPDGKVSLPLVGEVQAAGKTPPQLEAELRISLAQYIKDPELTIIVAEIRSRRVNIIGQVTRPGAFAITQQMGVLDVIAEAGGLKEFAKAKKIYVLRETAAGQRVRINYDYQDVLRGRKNATDIMLQANDTVVVP